MISYSWFYVAPFALCCRDLTLHKKIYQEEEGIFKSQIVETEGLIM